MTVYGVGMQYNPPSPAPPNGGGGDTPPISEPLFFLFDAELQGDPDGQEVTQFEDFSGNDYHCLKAGTSFFARTRAAFLNELAVFERLAADTPASDIAWGDLPGNTTNTLTAAEFFMVVQAEVDPAASANLRGHVHRFGFGDTTPAYPTVDLGGDVRWIWETFAVATRENVVLGVAPAVADLTQFNIYHGSHDGTRLKCYMNNALIFDEELAISWDTQPEMWIGNTARTQGFVGRLARYELYGSALNDSDRTQQYNFLKERYGL